MTVNRATLSAWQKLEKQVKDENSQYSQKESSYLENVKELQIKNEELYSKKITHLSYFTRPPHPID